MVLSEEQAEEIKNHLLKQIDNFPEDKRAEIKEIISSMSPDKVEAFIKENQLTHLGGQCIFCSIVSGNVKSFKIFENKDNIAVLEINPLSRGHTLVIPRSHGSEVGESAHELADFLSKKILEKLKPLKVQKKESEVAGHKVLEVIPIYGDEKGRKQATDKELEEIVEILKKKDEVIVENPKKTIEFPISKLPVIKPRIP